MHRILDLRNIENYQQKTFARKLVSNQIFRFKIKQHAFAFIIYFIEIFLPITSDSCK